MTDERNLECYSKAELIAFLQQRVWMNEAAWACLDFIRSRRRQDQLQEKAEAIVERLQHVHGREYLALSAQLDKVWAEQDRLSNAHHGRGKS